MITQSLVIAVLGLIILMSVPTITNMQATTNQSLAEIEMSCQWRLLNKVPLFLQLSEDQWYYFNSCLNSGGLIAECYDSAREINCDMYNSTRYNCPAVIMAG